MNSFAIRQAPHETGQDRLDTLVAGACRLAERSDEVRAVFVITRDRPGFHALMRYRTQAHRSGLTITVLGTGGVVVRRAQSTRNVDGAAASDTEVRVRRYAQ